MSAGLVKFAQISLQRNMLILWACIIAWKYFFHIFQVFNQKSNQIRKRNLEISAESGWYHLEPTNVNDYNITNAIKS